MADAALNAPETADPQSRPGTSPRRVVDPAPAAGGPTDALGAPLHRIGLLGFGSFERTTLELFLRMSEQRARRPSTLPSAPARPRGYVRVRPSQQPELVLINCDMPQAVSQAWRWPDRCISVGARSFQGAAAHLPRPVHMAALLELLDRQVQHAARVQAPLLQGSVASGQADRSRLALLLVDDNEHTVRSMRRFLRRLGLQADVARSGEEGLFRVAQGRFGLVLLDARMPGLNGWTVCRLIKTRPYPPGQAAPRVWVMARPDALFDPLRRLLSRCDGQLNKPLRKQDLHTLLLEELAQDALSATSLTPTVR